MPINLPQPELNRDAFDSICNRMALSDAERIAEAFPALFSPAFVYGDAPATTEPAKPALAKTKAPASTTAKPRERAISLSAEEQAEAPILLAYVKENPGARSRTITTSLDQRGKSRVLAYLVTAKMLSVQGKAAGARYYPVNGAPETGAEPEQAE